MLSAVPAWRVAGRLWLTAEVGGGTARVREVKVSTDYTQYAFNRWVGAYVIGAGVRVDVAAHVKAFAAYRYERTNQFTYDSFLPNGLQWETITDRPRMQGVTAGIAYHF
jgi:opacity protein-like surface antigen